MKKILIILILNAVFTLSACTEKTPIKASTEASIKVPEFSLTDTSGKVHTNQSSQGKYLIVNFWATWCPPCLKEIPDFVEFYEKHAQKVEILGMDYEDASKEKIAEFSDTFLINYPIILFDKKNSPQFNNFGEIIGMPTTYVYSPNGELIHHHTGALDITALEKLIL